MNLHGVIEISAARAWLQRLRDMDHKELLSLQQIEMSISQLEVYPVCDVTTPTLPPLGVVMSEPVSSKEARVTICKGKVFLGDKFEAESDINSE